MMAAYSAELIATSSELGLRSMGRARRGIEPWVARIVGWCRVYEYQREFLPPKRDYRAASKSGQSGVRFWWTLEPGVYEAFRRDHQYRGELLYLEAPGDGEVIEVDQERVDEWLANEASASMS